MLTVAPTPTLSLCFWPFESAMVLTAPSGRWSLRIKELFSVPVVKEPLGLVATKRAPWVAGEGESWSATEPAGKSVKNGWHEEVVLGRNMAEMEVTQKSRDNDEVEGTSNIVRDSDVHQAASPVGSLHQARGG